MPPTTERRRATPVDRERPFGLDELFVSTTDAKGILQSGNDVFVRVSGFARDELVGSAHNIIRHPDVPRAVFRTLWDGLGAGHGVAAYVKNLALNAVLSSTRLGPRGRALGAVAEILGRRSDEAEPAIRKLKADLDEAVRG